MKFIVLLKNGYEVVIDASDWFDVLTHLQRTGRMDNVAAIETREGI